MPASYKSLCKVNMRSKNNRELRNFFGFTRRSFTSIAKNPGRKYTFQLKHYIHTNDTVDTVCSVLTRIRDLQYYVT